METREENLLISIVMINMAGKIKLFLKSRFDKKCI